VSNGEKNRSRDQSPSGITHQEAPTARRRCQPVYISGSRAFHNTSRVGIFSYKGGYSS
jgi:hypothetical protein